MQRPVMNPAFYEETTTPARRRRFAFLSPAWRVLRWVLRVLLFRPLARRRHERLQIDDGTPVQRFIRGLGYRMACLPILLVLIVAALVFTGTHPPVITVDIDPARSGVYYDPVTFLSEDGVRLEGWLVPPVDARAIVEQQDEALRKRYPAVVLVHDYAAARDQLLPLVKPFHEAGMVVLVLSLRGSVAGNTAGTTFGLKESYDVSAAVEMLRRRHYVDAARIGVVGVGTGATASLLAARQDPGITVMVLQDPARSADEVIANHIGPQPAYLHWLNPFCKWAFEISYHVDSEELDLHRLSPSLMGRPVLVVDTTVGTPTLLHPNGMRQVEYFLNRHLVQAPDRVAAKDQDGSPYR